MFARCRCNDSPGDSLLATTSGLTAGHVQLAAAITRLFLLLTTNEGSLFAFWLLFGHSRLLRRSSLCGSLRRHLGFQRFRGCLCKLFLLGTCLSFSFLGPSLFFK